MPNLNQFMTEFQDGFQQPTRFVCQLFIPATVLNVVVTDNTILQLLDALFPSIGSRVDTTFSAARAASWLARGLVCDAARLPDRSFEQGSQTMYGITENFPVHTTYTDIQCNFKMPLLSNDNAIPRFFNYWMNFIQNIYNGPESGMNFTFPDDYRGQMYLTTYDRKDHQGITYFFDRVYPKTVDSVPLQWNNNNEFAALPVTFTYSYWKVLPYTPPPIIEFNTPIGRIGVGGALQLGDLAIQL